MAYIALIAVGLIAGVLAGMFGIGGGLVIVPGLIYAAKLTQSEAIGTSLSALVLPVGLLGAIEYYRTGNVNVKAALIVAVGLLVGTYFGAKILLSMQPAIARRVYAVFLLVMGVRMLFKS
ncbi:MAG: sulfite exporter TauE/SafE family protein [Acidobacteriota bacterium]|nr:sulfite exporter TauE/SafE family protein [Acidobacteriota bacterium]